LTNKKRGCYFTTWLDAKSDRSSESASIDT